MHDNERESAIAVATQDSHSSGRGEDVSLIQEVALRQQKRLAWILASSIITAVFLEFLGRALFKLFAAPFVLTGALTLGALFLWGAVSVYIILRLRSPRYVTLLVVTGACCFVFSQTVSVSVNFSPFLFVLLMETHPWVHLLLEEALFLVGLLALFAGFYASIFTTHRSILETEARRRLLADEVEERKCAQEALRQSEQTLSMLIAVNPESLLLVDAARRVLVANDAAARRLGCTPEALAGNDLLEFYPLNTRDTLSACFNKAAFSGALCRFEEERRDRYYESYICPVKGKDGNIHRYAVMNVDITDRRKMEEELRLLNRDLETGIRQRILELQRTNERLLDAINLNQELITVSPLGILVFTMSGSCLVANKAALEFLDCKAEELRDESQCLIPLLERFGLRDLAQAVRSGDASLWGEMHAVMPSGRERWLEYHASFFASAGEKHLLVMLSDVSDRMHARLVMEEQRQKLENTARITTLGQMAGDIAHEVRKPLSVLTLSVDQLKAWCDDKTLVREGLPILMDRILRSVSLMDEIVRSLTNLLREGAQDPFEAVPVKRILDDAMTLCHHSFQREKIELRLSEIPDITLECRSCQLSQVMANLLNNARDAVNALDEKWVSVDVYTGNDKVVFAVTDSGTIPAPTIRRKIFQPLFTTKTAGRGLGLGLSISKRLVESHKGRCVLDENHPNTRFLVELPLRQTGGEPPRSVS